MHTILRITYIYLYAAISSTELSSSRGTLAARELRVPSGETMYVVVEPRFDLKKAQVGQDWATRRVQCYEEEVSLSVPIPGISRQNYRERSTIWHGGLPLATATGKEN